MLDLHYPLAVDRRKGRRPRKQNRAKKARRHAAVARIMTTHQSRGGRVFAYRRGSMRGAPLQRNNARSSRLHLLSRDVRTGTCVSSAASMFRGFRGRCFR